ncbi:hypothetical protein C6P45_000543 [Maudiozyma exigua]|uniref:Sfi1 spindle body domain-containing protein n=1 Tax=Maudiozyma exigua TaxID=34358 RepID=A0A9P7B8J7_MAUEX|nr:hypothetical protein C6P45_000543 [Kazachstania exigua]
MVDDSTEELLKGTVKRNDIDSSDEDNSIEIDNHLNDIMARNIPDNDSTRALLLGQNNIHNFNFDNILRTPESANYSNDTNNDLNKDIYDEFRALGISQNNNNNNNELNTLQYDIVLNDLYITISQFLIGNQLSQAFIKIFKKYVNNLIQDGENPLKDKYILSLQTELDQNDQLTPHLEHLISILLLEPQNLIMRLTHYQINSNNRLLKKIFLKWRIVTTTNNYQTKLMNLYENYIKNKFLIKWIQKYRYYKQNERIKSVQANELRLKYMVFDKMLYKYDSIDKMQLLADTQFLNHIFQKLKSRRDQLKIVENNFDTNVVKPLLLEKYLQIWRLNVKLSTYSSVPTKRHIFHNWNKKLDRNENFVEIADISRTSQLLDTTFHTWQARSVKHTERLLNLQKSDGHVLKLKYFKKIIKNYNLLTKETQFIIKRNSMVKKNYFNNLWKKKFKDNLHYYSLSQIKSDNIRRKYFTILKKNFSQSIYSTNFLMDSITKKYWRIWRLEYRQMAVTEEKNLHKRKNFFTRWEQKFKHQKRYEKYEKESILRTIFKKWKQRYIIHQEFIYKARLHNRVVIEKRFLKIWLDRISTSDDLYLTADLFRNNHLFHLFMNRYETTNSKRIECENKNVKPVINHSLKFVFEIWKTRLEIKKHNILNDKLYDFTHNANDKLKQKYLTIIKKKYVLINQQFKSRAQTLERRNLGRIFFTLIIKKLERHDRLLSLALDSYELKLIRNHMDSWINKYADNGRLEEILLEHLDENNISMLSRYLSLWSVQSLKMERDNDSVRVFRKRWDRASVRGLLMLWKEKRENKYSTHDNIETQQVLNPIMQTPGKLASQDRDIIPGSATVRRNRMDAKISRYRRAIPSPYKNEGNSITRLGNDNINPRPGQLQFSHMTDLRLQQSGETLYKSNPRITSPTDAINNRQYLNGSPKGRKS